MNYFAHSVRFTLFMTLLCGLIYPLTMTGIAQVLFPERAGGQMVSRGGQVIGSKLIAQNFEKNEYFWPRPSAIGYNPLPSGGSNLGQESEALKVTVTERIAKLKASHPEKVGEPPQELIFASASGLDPHISPDAANYQAHRVANARHMNTEQIQDMIEKQTEPRKLGILGEPTVNVLALNLALDQFQGIESAPIPTPEKK